MSVTVWCPSCAKAWPAGRVEASVAGADIAAVPPLACHDLDGVVDTDVRDETSAPVARFAPGASGDWSLAETGGGVLASCWVADEDQDVGSTTSGRCARSPTGCP